MGILVECPTFSATTPPTSGIQRHEHHYIRTDLRASRWCRDQRRVLLARIDAGTVGQRTGSAGQAHQRLGGTRGHRNRKSGPSRTDSGHSRCRRGGGGGTTRGGTGTRRDQWRRHRGRLRVRRRGLERGDHCRCGRKRY